MVYRIVLCVLMVSVIAPTCGAAQKRAKAEPRARLTDQEIRTERRLYRKAPEGALFLHIYYPADWKQEDARPAIVFFFGGAWKKGTYQQFERQAEYFASRGLVAASADYRIQSKHGTTADKSVEDARSAVRWLRSHANELGIDPNKIIAAGGSAGGHLAAATALLNDFDAEDEDTSVSCVPNALVLFNPVVNLTKLPASGLVKAGANMKRRLSPTLFLTKSTPPAVLFYGTEDKFFPQGEEYAAKAKALGVRADLYVAPGMTHSFFNQSPWTESTANKADEFLESLGYLKGKPTVKLPADAPKLENR